MSFEYGSIDLGIRNPFKVEGWLRSARGIIVTLLGVYCVFQVKGTVENGGQSQAWIIMIAGVVLLASGLTASVQGMLQVFRFFVGRGVPTSLAANIFESEAHVEEAVAYDHSDIARMINGRKIVSFREPSNFFEHALHTLFRDLLFLPLAYQNLMMRISKSLLQTIAAFLSFFLAWFSALTGLSSVTDTPVIGWLTVFLSGYLLMVWGGNLRKVDRKNNEKIRIAPIVLWIVFTILLPFGLMAVHNNVLPLPEVPFDVNTYLSLIVVLAIVSSLALIFLIVLRGQQSNPIVEVSEYRDTWENCNDPQEVFTNFETKVMANRRFQEVPNRNYRDWPPDLARNSAKGKFESEIIQETQPVFRPVPTTKTYRNLRIALTATGQLFLLTAAILITIWAANFGVSWSAANSSIENMFGEPIVIYSAIILGIFGSIVAKSANIFWAEMQFESTLVYFRAEGTYREAIRHFGKHERMGVEKSNMESTINPWIQISTVISSCFTSSGSQNMEFPRIILAMHKHNDLLDDIVNETKAFNLLHGKLAGVQNSEATVIGAVNDAIVSNNRSHPANPSLLVDTDEGDGDGEISE